MPYDPNLPLVLATDASKTGLGAVLSHRLVNGQERPIAYASRTMSPTEQRYPQIDKEALAIVWAVQKFFKYLYARRWTLITDHKPLTQILHPEKSLPVLCISRMANYADFMSNFNFEVVYRTSSQNANADFLSRIVPVKQMKIQAMSECAWDEFDLFIIRQINQLAKETRNDPELGKIFLILQKGQCLLKNGYKSPEANFKLSGNCLVFDHRIVIPPKYRKAILQSLHAAHLGMCKMKGMARSFVYWPRIDADIEMIARDCGTCASVANKPRKCEDHHWEYPKGPWERVHMDYAGPFEGMMLLIITNAYSKWLEVKVTKSMTAAATIALVDEVFADYGVPAMVVTDNGTNFSSEEFNQFLTYVGVKYHKYTAPFHPATNGQAERSVQSVKNALKAMGTTNHSLRKNLNEFIRQYKNAPHSTTGVSPAQLFLGRQLRTRLDLVRPDDISEKLKAKQYIEGKDKPCRQFKVGDDVYFLSGHQGGSKWLRGCIKKRLGHIHYEIQYQNKSVKRHIEQIRRGSRKDIGNPDSRRVENHPQMRRDSNSFQEREDVSDNEDSTELMSEGSNSPFLGFETDDDFETPTQQANESVRRPSTETPPPQSLRRSSRVTRPRVLFAP